MKLRTWCIRSGQKLAKPVLVFAGFLVFLTIFNPATIHAEDDRGGITLRHENVPIQKVFQTIEKQSGYRFFYNETLLQGSVKVTLHLENVSLQEALDACFRNQPLSYAIVDKTIIVKRRPEQQSVAPIPAAEAFSAPKKGKLIAVRGKVTSNNVPVVGASIMIKGTDNGASTDKDGVFTLAEVDEEATLIVSSVSHQAREVKVNGQGFITIDLAQKSDDLDDAVVVAYNTTTKRMNTGSITVVKGEQIATLPNRSFDKSLQGYVPGLLVTPGTGMPGGGTSNFVLRGIATNANPEGGSVVRNPLIVIDGVPVSQETTQLYISSATTSINNPLAQLNPADIESITVLKDAAAIALYGANSGNGVIMVTTKRGKAGKTNFTFRHQTDLAGAVKLPQPLSQDEYLELLYEAYKNAPPRIIGGVSTPWTDNDILADLKTRFPIKSDGSFYPDPNWKKALFKNGATTSNNELSVAGGNDKTTFYLSGEYTKQNGLVKGTQFDRKSFRLNFEHQPVKFLKFGINSTVSQTVQDYGGSTANGNDANMEGASIIGMSPLNPIYLENGNYNLNYSFGAYLNKANPVAANEFNLNRNTGYRGLSNLYTEINFLKKIKFKSTLGFDYTVTETKEKADPRLNDPGISGTGGRIEERDTRRTNLISTNMLHYGDIFKQAHRIDLLVGQEARVVNQKILGVGVKGQSSPYYDQITSPGATILSQVGYVTKETLLSYFSQLNYDYKGRYLLSGTIRRDGSSRFGEDKRFGTYWSTGIGWVVSEEPLVKPAKGWLNYFKIRGSIGAAGSSGAIDRFTPYNRLSSGLYLGNTAVQLSGTQAGNADVKWEQSFTWDAGLEFRLFKNLLNFTADIYQRTTDNLIYSVPLPGFTGYRTMLDNMGTMRNRGVELSATANLIRNKSFSWQLTANWSTNNNVLVKANNDLVQSQSNLLAYNKQGENFNSFYLPIWMGVDPANGNPLWLDSTGKASSDYDAAKPQFVGKSQPDGFGAVINTLSYRGIELSVMIYYQYGFQVYNLTRLVNDGFSPYKNETIEALDRWQKPGDIAKNPKRILNNPIGNSAYYSTRNLFDGDYIRLQNVSLAYQLPEKILKPVHLKMVKVYVQGNNLAVWTKDKGYGDPAAANVYGGLTYSYPIQRAFSVGLNVMF